MTSLRSVRSRAAIGICAGLIAGILGPTLSAVAGKSGNREPEPASVSASESFRRGATWYDVVDLGSKTRKFSFYVWTELTATGSADTTTRSAWQDWRGEAVVAVKTCTKSTNVCTTKTFRGPVGNVAPVGAATGTNYYIQDSAMGAAQFGGSLSDGSSSCTFELRWVAITRQPSDPSPSYFVSPDASGPSARAGEQRVRWADVTAASSCYASVQGTGQVWETLEAAATSKKA